MLLEKYEQLKQCPKDAKTAKIVCKQILDSHEVISYLIEHIAILCDTLLRFYSGIKTGGVVLKPVDNHLKVILATTERYA